MKIRKIAVVFTYYNRKEKTINCINKLHASVEKMGNTVQLSYYACDDGSTDNTSDELKKKSIDKLVSYMQEEALV